MHNKPREWDGKSDEVRVESTTSLLPAPRWKHALALEMIRHVRTGFDRIGYDWIAPRYSN